MKQILIIGAVAALATGCASTSNAVRHCARDRQSRVDQGQPRHGDGHVRRALGKVYVTAEVSGLAPNQEHGFHVHEKGDCSSGDGMSAGGHFNPDGKPHGPQNAPHHAGDMPSLKADAAGNAKASFVLDDVTVAAGPKSVVGRGLIVHKDPDDFKTQPTGNAGARLACAVIRAS